MESITTTSRQYQHFVPQFLLRNFSHPFKSTATRNKSQRGRREDKTRHNEDVVNLVDLSSDAPTVVERPVRRVLGQFNMYRNTALSQKEQDKIEEKLSRLESHASKIFRRILTDFDKAHRGLWLTRKEKNLIRQFLFVMKYRGPTFYERYNHETIATYSADDKEDLTAYMKEKGFSRPVEVWLDNLDQFIELQMDNELKWVSELQNRTYGPDGLWAVMHCQMMHMSICTPSNSHEQFLISDNCYHVAEGPHQIEMDLVSGQPQRGAWLNLHEFAPISPRLLIVLRSFLFSSPEEDKGNHNGKIFREKCRSMVEPIFGSLDKTLLADLPVSKPRNNYSQLVEGRFRMLPDEDGSLKDEHTFFFKFHPISTTHVNRINGVFLENLNLGNSLIFYSAQAFRRSLEWYMTDRDTFPKRVIKNAADGKLARLTKLAALLNQLGSAEQPFWEEIPSPDLTDKQWHRLWLMELRRAFPSLLEQMPKENPTESMQIHRILGGSNSTLPKDMKQAQLMLNLRIKIDAKEQVRETNRMFLDNEYLQFPRRRLWLYLKHWRCMRLQDENNWQYDDFYMSGPEDVIARVWTIIKRGRLNNMMYRAVGNEIIRKTLPDFNPWARITLDDRGLDHFCKLQEYAFSEKIQDCGIEQIEKLSSTCIVRFSTALTVQGFNIRKPVFRLEQLAEILTRMTVKKEFKILLRGILEEDVLDSFTTIFFELLYPTPPSFECLFLTD
ncbi:hypothetical protein QQS21_009502 [Conoideocrella luteorostrata]|uniref:DUF4238 domain-containing protein n=1 Tax=Conoideocrella luteorostrata TaxID=1105319 RepID=A0AAJ0FVK8_9HYPO|nr:hypothetical protein QQS21_009502 [Conoideocrella luteorostrata]